MEPAPEKDVSDQTTRVDLTQLEAAESAATEPVTAAGTSAPTRRSSRRATQERLARINEEQKKRSRKGFLVGLVVGQLLVLSLSWGGDWVQSLLAEHLRLETPMPVRSLVFCAMTAGIGITGALILLVLAFQGVGWFFTKKTVSFGVALWRGIKRTCRAAWSLGLTLVVIGGTAWLLIPPEEWTPTAAYLREKGEKGYTVVREWVEEFIPKGEEPVDAPEPESPE